MLTYIAFIDGVHYLYTAYITCHRYTRTNIIARKTENIPSAVYYSDILYMLESNDDDKLLTLYKEREQIAKSV